jgi:hypothetical protein
MMTCVLAILFGTSMDYCDLCLVSKNEGTNPCFGLEHQVGRKNIMASRVYVESEPI